LKIRALNRTTSKKNDVNAMFALSLLHTIDDFFINYSTLFFYSSSSSPTSSSPDSSDVYSSTSDASSTIVSSWSILSLRTISSSKSKWSTSKTLDADTFLIATLLRIHGGVFAVSDGGME
jgi:hypothetical protein